MIDIFHVHAFTVRKAASLITADIYMPSIDKKKRISENNNFRAKN